MIFDIKRYAIHDGPGIRLTVFFKGCPLSCVWCHNPEGIAVRKEKLYTRKKCIGCETCVRACPRRALSFASEGIATNSALCTVCGTCADVCPALAMEISGQEYSAERLMEEIEKETLFMDRSKGGVTFCGGEPLMQPDYLLHVLRLCGERNIHRAVDTTLYARPEVVGRIVPHTDLFLIDLKLMDSDKHRRYCGVPNELILSNIRKIAGAGKDFRIRIPLIEGINADEGNLRCAALFIAGLPGGGKKVDLLPYHDIGKGKHEKLGTKYNPDAVPMSAPSRSVQERAVSIFREQGIEVKIGG